MINITLVFVARTISGATIQDEASPSVDSSWVHEVAIDQVFREFFKSLFRQKRDDNQDRHDDEFDDDEEENTFEDVGNNWSQDLENLNRNNPDDDAAYEAVQEVFGPFKAVRQRKQHCQDSWNYKF